MATSKKSLRLIVLLAVIAVLILSAVMLIKRKKQELANAREFGLKPRPVTVAEAKSGSFTQKLPFLAVVEPVQTADISARVTAAVEKVLCDEGDRVKAGDALVKLEDAEMEHRVESVSAQIKQAQADLAGNRETVKALESSLEYFDAEAQQQRNLAEKDSVPVSQADRAEEKKAEVKGKLKAARQKSAAIQHRISSLKKQKEELRARLDYYTITSPFNGVVAERFVDPGDQASPGKILTKLEDRSALKLVFDVPQQDLPEVKVKRAVRFSAGNDKRSAGVSLMYPSLNKARMMRAEVLLSDDKMKGLTPGAYVPLSVVVDRRKEVTLVPRSSLIKSPQDNSQYVFTVENNKLAAQQVNVIGFADDRAAVEGVDPGMSVVRTTFLGWAQLSSGEKVEAVR